LGEASRVTLTGIPHREQNVGTCRRSTSSNRASTSSWRVTRTQLFQHPT